MPDPTYLFLCILYSSIGYGFYRYGKRQQRLIALVCGIALMLIPYFIATVFQLILVGVVLIALPILIRS